jgi:hypothetical protein
VALVASFLSHAAHQFAKERLGGTASPLVFLRRHVGRVAEPSTPWVLRGDDARPGSVTTSSIAGAPGFGCFVVTIRDGMATGCFRFRARFGRWFITDDGHTEASGIIDRPSPALPQTGRVYRCRVVVG